jgi:hypothetical protein
MAKGVSPEVMAKRIQKWADKGLDYAMVTKAKDALALDVVESRLRIRSKTGRLAKTVRLTEPSATLTARRGFFRINLAAGSKAKGSPVRYASVLQLGRVGGPFGVRRSHVHFITAKRGSAIAFQLNGQRRVFEQVVHPGSRFPAQEYLRINPERASRTIEAGVQKSAEKEL